MDLRYLTGSRRKQLIGASMHFARHTVPAVVRPARILWHQMIGFLFLAMAVAPARFAYKAIENFKGDGKSWTEIILSGIFMVVMATYGISSLLRARKLSRS